MAPTRLSSRPRYIAREPRRTTTDCRTISSSSMFGALFKKVSRIGSNCCRFVYEESGRKVTMPLNRDEQDKEWNLRLRNFEWLQDQPVRGHSALLPASHVAPHPQEIGKFFEATCQPSAAWCSRPRQRKLLAETSDSSLVSGNNSRWLQGHGQVQFAVGCTLAVMARSASRGDLPSVGVSRNQRGKDKLRASL